MYFAGHGETETVAGIDYGYIVPYDGTTDSDSYISMEDIRDISARLGTARHQLFLLDSCFGGLVVTRAPVGIDPNMPGYLEEATKRKAIQVLTAGGKNQQVVDNGPNGHSPFTSALLEAIEQGLADTWKDGFITFSELTTYVEARASNKYQTPGPSTLPGHGQGQFLFRAPSASPADKQIAPTAATTKPTLRSSDSISTSPSRDTSSPLAGGANNLPTPPAARAIAPTASTVRQIRVFVSAASSQSGLINSDVASVQDSVHDVRESILDKRKESLQVVERPEDADVRIEVTKRLTRGTTQKASPGGRNSPYIQLCVVQAALVAGDHREEIEGTVSDQYRLAGLWRTAANDLTGQVETFAKNNRDALISRRAR